MLGPGKPRSPPPMMGGAPRLSQMMCGMVRPRPPSMIQLVGLATHRFATLWIKIEKEMIVI